MGEIFNSISQKFQSGLASAKSGMSSLSEKVKSGWASLTTGGTRKKRQYGGIFHAMTPNHGIASTASRISGSQYAKAHYVGGKRRKKSKCQKHHRHTSKCR
jgi:O-acetyl-ADP-ribose deacetylase (regulator of RNase III)